MGEEKTPSRVKLFFGLLFSDAEVLARAETRIINDYGEVDLSSPVEAFNKTSYYEKEMGPGLKRKFIAISNLMKREELPSVKLQTNRLEQLFAGPDGKRRINIDPGYLTLSKVVLATTKDYDHRLYLGKKIFGEVTLHYKSSEKGYLPWEWTYPDYREDMSLAFFNQLREIYHKQMREKS